MPLFYRWVNLAIEGLSGFSWDTKQVGRSGQKAFSGYLIIYTSKEYSYLWSTLCFPSYVLNNYQGILITSPKHCLSLGLLNNSCDTNLGNRIKQVYHMVKVLNQPWKSLTKVVTMHIGQAESMWIPLAVFL